MKLVTFSTKDNEAKRLGAISEEGSSIADLQSGIIALSGKESLFLRDMLSFLDGGKEAHDLALELLENIETQKPPSVLLSKDEARLHAPVPCPRSIRDCMAFERHIVQATRTVVKWKFPPIARLDAWMEEKTGRPIFGAPGVWYERPLYYKGNTMSVIGHDEDVIWPSFTEKLDYELEFGIYISKKGRNIPKEKAREYIAGYTIFNDFSARDIQLNEMKGKLGPAKGKDFDTGNVMGPYLVTPDEIPDPYSLGMTARINGEEWSCANSRDMRYSFEEMIAYISRDETLYPGEFIGSGTVGDGCGLELDRWIKSGDIVELKVEGLGILRNRVKRP